MKAITAAATTPAHQTLATDLWSDANIQQVLVDPCRYEVSSVCNRIFEKFRKYRPEPSVNDVRMVSLMVKNEAEETSGTSDGVPMIAGVVAAFFAVLTGYAPFAWLSVLSLLPSAFFAFLFLKDRVQTRRKVAKLKILANYLDFIEKNFSEIVREVEKPQTVGAERLDLVEKTLEA